VAAKGLARHFWQGKSGSALLAKKATLKMCKKSAGLPHKENPAAFD